MQRIHNFFLLIWEAIVDGAFPILFAIGIFLLLFLCRKIVAKLLVKIFCRIFRKLPSAVEIIQSFERPLAAFAVCLGIYLALSTLARQFLPEITVLSLFLNAYIRISVIIALTWGLMQAATPITSAIVGGQNDLDKTLVFFFSRIGKGILLILAAVIIIRETGYDISGLITGLGLSGLTFALAAQDSASNLFGGLVIIGDKPFAVDDWIQTPNTEGIVTDITLRSTRIRTFKDAEIVVPNSTLVNVPITNWSRMSKRRVHFSIGVEYQTSQEKLQEAVKGIRAILQSHPDLIVQDGITVCFDNFGAYSLNIEIYYFTILTSWADYMSTKETINFEIRGFLEKIGVGIAFPTQVILTPENNNN